VAGAEVMVILRFDAALVPQLLVVVTLTEPEVFPAVTVIEFVPEPAVIVVPVGSDQL
jgi:hypothetical protein